MERGLDAGAVLLAGGTLALLVGCGRIDFDAASNSTTMDATGGADDGPPTVSCGPLASTCGPQGTSPCCESLMVTGGMFFRSYDVAADAAYPSMVSPAMVSPFRLDKYEVTVGRFREFVAAGMGTQQNPPTAGDGARTLNGTANQGGWDIAWNGNLRADTTTLIAAIKCDATYQTWTDTPGGNENRPMNCITWYDAMAFCVWDGGYLPSEAEWNFAAAGGSDQRGYAWSNPPSALTLDDSSYASYFVDATKQCYGDMTDGCAVTDLVPVGSKPAGDGRWGQSDLGGNAWEWMLDWYATTYPTPCVDCANLTPGTVRTIRGGGFSNDATYLRVAVRVGNPLPSDRLNSVGVRCARPP